MVHRVVGDLEIKLETANMTSVRSENQKPFLQTFDTAPRTLATANDRNHVLTQKHFETFVSSLLAYLEESRNLLLIG